LAVCNDERPKGDERRVEERACTRRHGGERGEERDGRVAERGEGERQSADGGGPREVCDDHDAVRRDTVGPDTADEGAQQTRDDAAGEDDAELGRAPA
jgi:hypothetical protein